MKCSCLLLFYVLLTPRSSLQAQNATVLPRSTVYGSVKQTLECLLMKKQKNTHQHCNFLQSLLSGPSNVLRAAHQQHKQNQPTIQTNE